MRAACLTHRGGRLTVDFPDMGFWGTIVVYRGEPLLAELLPEVEEFHEAELDYDRVNGAWEVSRVYLGLRDLPADLLLRLRDATGAPVRAAEVFDSDGAFVHALGNQAVCRAWLQLDGALGYLLTPYTINGNESAYVRENDDLRTNILAETPGGAVAAAAAIEWAHEAGLTPTGLDELAAVFDGRSVFVEEHCIKLLNSLGLDTAAVALPAPLPFDVLSKCVGHRVEGVDRVPHHAARQRRVQPGAVDLRLRFEGSPPVTVCGCTMCTLLLPETQAESEPFGEPFANLLGHPLTAAATLDKGIRPNGIALRFGDTTIWLALVDSDWVTDEAVLRSREYKVSRWFADEFDARAPLE
jgi:hypothetical protein